MAYKHKIVEGLSQLISLYAGKGTDPFMKAVWMGIKGQVPSLLQTLDDNDGAVKEIEKKLMEMLDVQPKVEPEQVSLTRQAALREDEKPVAEKEATTAPSVPQIVSEEEPPEPQKRKKAKSAHKEEVKKATKKALSEKAKKPTEAAEAEITVEPATEEKDAKGNN